MTSLPARDTTLRWRESDTEHHLHPFTNYRELAAEGGSRIITAADGVSLRDSEGNRLLESVDELITIAREAGLPAQIYHLKAAGRSNWDKLDAVIERVEAARAEGLAVTADMYTYTAGSTGLNAAMPPSVQEGGFEAWRTAQRRNGERA